MAEAVGQTRDETAGMWVAVILLAGSFLLFLLQVPGVMRHAYEFSPWLYLPALLSFFVALWKRADHVAMLAGFWLSLFFIIDIYYGVSFFG